MNEPSKLGKGLRFVGLGLVLTSFLTFDVLLLLWFVDAAESWRWLAIAGGAAFLVLGALLVLIGGRVDARRRFGGE